MEPTMNNVNRQYYFCSILAVSIILYFLFDHVRILFKMFLFDTCKIMIPFFPSTLMSHLDVNECWRTISKYMRICYDLMDFDQGYLYRATSAATVDRFKYAETPHHIVTLTISNG